MSVIAGSDALTTSIVEHLHQRFVEAANPLYVWEAYRLVRQRNVPCLLANGELGLMACEPLPLPAWVTDYLDSCADGLLSGVPPARALRLATKGGHGKLKQLADASRDAGIFSFLDFCMQLEPDTKPPYGGEGRLEVLCDRVAEATTRKGNRFSKKPLSAKTIRDVYFRLKP